MDRPFREIHELYKLLYERALAQQKAEEERKKEEEKKEREAARKGPPQRRYPSTDVNNKPTPMPTPSPYEMEMLEDAMEELS